MSSHQGAQVGIRGVVVRAASKRGRICGWAEKKRMRYAIYTRRDKKQKDSENRGFIYQKITH